MIYERWNQRATAVFLLYPLLFQFDDPGLTLNFLIFFDTRNLVKDTITVCKTTTQNWIAVESG